MVKSILNIRFKHSNVLRNKVKILFERTYSDPPKVTKSVQELFWPFSFHIDKNSYHEEMPSCFGAPAGGRVSSGIRGTVCRNLHDICSK